jgi:hypothetical protein
MSERPALEQRLELRRWLWQSTLLTAGLLALLLHPVVPIGAYGLYSWVRQRPRWRWHLWGLAVLGGSWFFFKSPEQLLLYRSPTSALEGIVVALPVIPVVAVCIEPGRRLQMFLRPKGAREFLEDENKRITAYNQKLSQAAGQRESRPPEPQPNNIRLGAFVKGDPLPERFGFWQRDGWLTLDDKVLNQHCFILGQTGYGKSETLKRLLYEVAMQTERDIIVVDGKGEEAFAQEIRAICYQGRGDDAPIFRLGQARLGYPYNGFQGDADAVYNRLLAMIRLGEAEGDAEYYDVSNREVLQLICKAPKGPPRSFIELWERMSLEWLEKTWGPVELERETLDDIKQDKRAWGGLKKRVRVLARDLGETVDPCGFALGEVGSAVFSLRTQSVGGTAERFLQFLIEDLKDYVGKRQDRPGLLVIDEFGVFGNQNIAKLLALGRSANMEIVLATQTVTSLGDERSAENILGNTVTKVLMKTDFPEYVGELAGTKYQVETSYQHEEGKPTGMGSAQFQHTFKVDMNEVRRLEPGEAFIIRDNKVCKVKVAMMPKVEAAPDEVIPERPPDSPPADDRKPDRPVIRP